MDAFATLFEPLRPLVFTAASRMVGADQANDVVMETFLKAWQALPRFRGGSSLSTWLFRISRNCSVDMIRKARRFESIDAVDEAKGASRLDRMADERSPSPDADMSRGETVEVVRKALEQLPEEHGVALKLRYADGMKYSEIAAVTGVAIGTVMSRLFNGKRKLMKLIREEGIS